MNKANVNLSGVMLRFLFSADLHECCLAWLGHSHVPLPGYPALVLKLPHRQVKTFFSYYRSSHCASYYCMVTIMLPVCMLCVIKPY